MIKAITYKYILIATIIHLVLTLKIICGNPLVVEN